MSAYLWRGKVAGVVSIEATPAAIYGSMAVSMTAMLLLALQLSLLEARISLFRAASASCMS